MENPMQNQADDIDVIKTTLSWLEQGHQVALATVTSTWGSAPRKAGSHMAIRDDGLFTGSVSGGCIEGATVEKALTVLNTHSPVFISFGVTSEDAWSVGLACGGEISIWLTPITKHPLNELLSAIARREAVVLIGDKNQTGLVVEPISEIIPSIVVTEETSVRRFYPPVLRLVVVGATHITQVLYPMAQMLGYSVEVVDPRSAFAQSGRWQDANVQTLYPDEWIASNPLDNRCAVVTLSHDPKIDDPALRCALSSDAFYIGALGSRRTHATRLDRLKSGGYSSSELTRIHGPVGLSIGAQTPAEIAASILAELTQVLRKGQTS